MRVLVTGASGALGGDVAASLVAAGHGVRTLQRRSSNVDGADDVLASVTDAAARDRATAGMDAVVHLAAKVSMAGPLAEFETVNVEGTRGLLDAAHRAGAAPSPMIAVPACATEGDDTCTNRAGVARFVHVSSPSVAHAGTAIMGEGAAPADPHRARGPYARTKARGEVLALAADANDFAVVAVRPHLVWGPGDTQLIARIVERARRGRLPLLGSGAALIDTTYRDNATSAIVAALGRADAAHGRPFVVSNGEPRTIAELFEAICRAAGVRPPRWRVPARAARVAGLGVEALWAIRPGADEPPMTRFLAEQLSTAHWFDQRATREALDWAPAVTIDEGLARLAASYREGPRD